MLILTIFLTIFFWYLLKLIYNVFIIIVTIQLIGRIKAKGKEILANKVGESEGENNG